MSSAGIQLKDSEMLIHRNGPFIMGPHASFNFHTLLYSMPTSHTQSLAHQNTLRLSDKWVPLLGTVQKHYELLYVHYGEETLWTRALTFFLVERILKKL